MEIAQLPSDEQREFLEELGVQESTKNRFIRHLYGSLDMISFLTAGEDEVRSWSIADNSTAARAAGKIHSDLERGFIRSEVVHWEDLLEAGGFKQAKTANKVRLKGRDYRVRDGDVLTVLFNV